MITEKSIDQLNKYLIDQNISEEDILLLFANLLRQRSDYYKELDLTSKSLTTEQHDIDDYYSIKTGLEYFPNSTFLILADIIHKLLYTYNIVNTTKLRCYGQQSK